MRCSVSAFFGGQLKGERMHPTSGQRWLSHLSPPSLLPLCQFVLCIPSLGKSHEDEKSNVN